METHSPKPSRTQTHNIFAFPNSAMKSRQPMHLSTQENPSMHRAGRRETLLRPGVIPSPGTEGNGHL